MALPNRPSRTFSYVYDVFASSESPKSTFGALGLFGAVRIAMGVKSLGGRRDGTLRPGTGWLRGGAPAKSYHVCGSASIPPPLQFAVVAVERAPRALPRLVFFAMETGFLLAKKT